MNFTSIREAVAGIFKPVAELVDNVHTSDEERGELHNKLVGIQAGVMGVVSDLYVKTLEAKQQIIVSEQAGDNILQKAWRPLTMINFLILLNLNMFGVGSLSAEMQLQLMSLLQLGIGGYIGGRTLEKITPKIADAFGRAREGKGT